MLDSDWMHSANPQLAAPVNQVAPASDHPMAALAAVSPNLPHNLPNEAQHSFLQHLAGAMEGFGKGMRDNQPRQIESSPQIQLSVPKAQAFTPHFTNLVGVMR